MKKLFLMLAIVGISIAVNAQVRPIRTGGNVVLKPDNKLKKLVVRWVCKVEDVKSTRLKIDAVVNIIEKDYYKEQLVITSNLNLEKIEFYNIGKTEKQSTYGVAGASFKSETFLLRAGNYIGGFEKGYKILCYLPGSTEADATINVIPLKSYQ